ncbi:hypothetical protein DL765_005121 [Monosporascus sp. GIB2]|nr:hypothetical protein DL765_005121 [Monosporascus sp. GIB2]
MAIKADRYLLIAPIRLIKSTKEVTVRIPEAPQPPIGIPVIHEAFQTAEVGRAAPQRSTEYSRSAVKKLVGAFVAYPDGTLF